MKRFSPIKTDGLPAIFSTSSYVAMILGTIVFASIVLWRLFSTGEILYHSMAIQGTGLTADLVEEMRRYYATEVVSVVKAHGIAVSPRIEGQNDGSGNSIPLPVSFALEVGKRLNEIRPGAEIKVYSNYPFPWRKDGGPQDDFERSAIEAVTHNPQIPFYRFEAYKGRDSLRFAKADIMASQCVKCHNTAPQSPKTDWKVGDVRGVVEIVRPLDNRDAQVFSTKENLIRAFGITVLLTALGIGGLAFVLFLFKRRSVRLVENSLRIHSIITTSTDGIVTIGEDRLVESFNPQAEKLFGYSGSEIIGENVAYIIPDLSLTIGVREVSGRRKDGSRFPFELSLSAMTLNERRVFTCFIRDVSDKKAMEQELLQGQKLQSVGQLAAGIAHEINTPIQYVGDNVQFLDDAFKNLEPVFAGHDKMLETLKTDNVHPELVKEVDFNIRTAQLDYLRAEIPQAISQTTEGLARVAKIVRAMKEFSHPGGADKTSADLNAMIESAIIVSTNEWKYLAEMETDLDRTLPRIPCYVGELNQVLLNIIVNASHAIEERLGKEAKEKGKISVSTSLKGDFAEIRIRDTGGGIPEAIRPRIFDPFFTTKEVGKGTGQGLAIARSVVVDKHGGSLTFETEIGVGTVFIIRLHV